MPRRLLAGAALLLFAAIAETAACSRSAAPAGAAAAPQSPATLAQVMRGILFPNSNVIFAAQHDEFAQVKADPDTSLATDPIKGVYGGWEAVENASLAIVEATQLITLPGRQCMNGRPVPVQDPEFIKFVADLRAAGLLAYKAAQSKDQDQILAAAEKLGVTCSHCHTAYREKPPEKGGEANRCTK